MSEVLLQQILDGQEAIVDRIDRLDEKYEKRFDDLRNDHQQTSEKLAVLSNEVSNLRKSIDELKDEDRTLHERIGKKEERVVKLEVRQNDDEQRLTALETWKETSSGSNWKWMTVIGVVCTILATLGSSVFGAIISSIFPR